MDEDPIVVNSVEWDDDMVVVNWFDRRQQSPDSTVTQTTYMRMDSVEDSEKAAYALAEIRDSASALLAYWKAAHG